MSRSDESPDERPPTAGDAPADLGRGAATSRTPVGAAASASSDAGLGGLALAGLGFQFAASLVASYYLGQWLDRRLGTAPVFLLIVMLVGSGSSFFAMYRQLMRAQRREDAARRARSATGREAGR